MLTTLVHTPCVPLHGMVPGFRSSLRSLPSRMRPSRRLPSTFEELYEVGPLLGKGGFGVVHDATERATGNLVAVKTLPKRFGPGGTLAPPFAERVKNEIDVYRRLGASLNIAFLYGAFENDKAVRLVIERCSGGPLWSRLEGGSTEADAAVIMREVLRVVAQCHAKDVVLRDVKCENFLFLDDAPDSPLKAIDFGSAVHLPHGQFLHDKHGTIVYLAPEVVRGKYAHAVDVWSAGIVACLLLTGRLPFSGEDGQDVTDHMARNGTPPPSRDVFRAILYAPLDFQAPPWDTLSPEAVGFVQALLQRDPTQRMTAYAALQHPWLQQLQTGTATRRLEDTVIQRLQRFGTFGRFKQQALRVIARHMTASGAEAPAFVQDLEAMWALLCAQAGTEDRLQFAALLQGLRHPRFDLSTEELAQLVRMFPVGAGGWVSREAWFAALCDWQLVEASADGWDAAVAAAFASFDRDGDQLLSRRELETLLCGEAGCEGFDEEVEATLRLADGDGDGVISLQDFQEAVHTELRDNIDLFESRLASEHEHRP